MRSVLSIIVPVLNDAEPLRALLEHLQTAYGALNHRVEVIVVDGGSSDGGPVIAARFGANVEQVLPGRGLQLNAGFRLARADLIWMLHADSLPAPDACDWLARYRTIGWGRFDVAFEDAGLEMRLVAALMNRRSRLTGICTGDQGIFAHRRLLERIGGIPEQPLMEDVELSRCLAHLCAPACPAFTVTTSARRWRQKGWLTTVLGMWWFRFQYWTGVSPEVLARRYHD